MVGPMLRAPVDETLAWLRERLTDIPAEGRERGELAASLDPQDGAATIAAILQGGYVLARAADSVAPL